MPHRPNRQGLAILLLAGALSHACAGDLHPGKPDRFSVQLGPRPYHLVDNMAEGRLKDKLASCSEGPFRKSDFSIGHRGACLQFPEHTEESYRAAAQGIHIIAPPMWALLSLDAAGKLIPSDYTLAAKRAGLDIITWTLERSGPLNTGGGYYYQSVTPAIDRDGDTFEALDVLARKVGVLGVFSDWPATVTYYANCFLK